MSYRYFVKAILAVSILVSLAVSGRASTEPHVAAVWAARRGGDTEILHTELASGVWQEPRQLTRNRQDDVTPWVDVAPDGTLWITWIRLNGARRELYCASRQNGRWSSQARVPTGCAINTSPSIAVDTDDLAWIVWSGFDGADDDILAVSGNGATWDTPERVHPDNDVPDVFPRASIAGPGQLQATWSGYDGELGYKTYSSLHDGSEWTVEAQADSAIAWIDEARDWISGLIAGAPFKDVDNACVVISSGGKRFTCRVADLKQSQPAQTTPVARATGSGSHVILCFGDSITQGYPYLRSPGQGTTGGGYEWILALIYRLKGQSVTVRNYGWGGENSYSGAARFPSVVAAHPEAREILIMEGTNDDGLLSPQTTAFNLGIMVQLSRNAGIKPLLATLPPDTRNSNDDTERLYNPAIRNLAAEMGVPLSDQYKALAPRWNRWSDDDVHPNWIGYLVMAIEWYLTLT